MERVRINGPKMQGPATYQIRVQGIVAANWSDRLEGMNITRDGDGEGRETTVLVGRLPDQAALTGVLATLYELHFPVISVECLEVG